MTVSVVAIISEVVRGSDRLVGYGFNSNGGYAQSGLLRERFIPRLLDADPMALVDADGVIDPERTWEVMMQNEKPGGHGERSVAVGILDMALWDLTAKLLEVPLAELLASRYGQGTAATDVDVYAAGGYYAPDKGLETLQRELASYVEQGCERVKIKIGGAPLHSDHDRWSSGIRSGRSGMGISCPTTCATPARR